MKQSNDIDKLIALYLEAKASPKETEELEEWVSLSPENKEYYLKLKNIWDVSGSILQKKGIRIDEALLKVMSQIDDGQTKVRFWKYLQKISAILLLPFLLGGIMIGKYLATWHSDKQALIRVEAPLGIRSSIELTDGSKVWLNSGSVLEYPQKFRKTREVNLLGEAYFEVNSNPAKPFIVHSNNVSIKATGTKFNVRAIEGSKKLYVTLKEGKVNVGNFNGKNQTVQLKPSQHLAIDMESGEQKLTTGNIDNYLVWKDGILVFRNVPMVQVLEEISRYYNVDIRLEDEELKEYSYRATFDNEPLEEILKLLKFTSPIDYRIIGREKSSNGLYTKEKIVIFKKKPN